MGTLAVRSGWGILSRAAWPCALHDSSSCSTRSRRTHMRRIEQAGVYPSLLLLCICFLDLVMQLRLKLLLLSRRAT